MIAKTSIRFINKKRVRARWNEETTMWWYAATDVVDALIETKNSRRYWNTFKTRHTELSSFCRQLKMTASDGKMYVTDCLNQVCNGLQWRKDDREGNGRRIKFDRIPECNVPGSFLPNKCAHKEDIMIVSWKMLRLH